MNFHHLEDSRVDLSRIYPKGKLFSVIRLGAPAFSCGARLSAALPCHDDS